MSWHSLGNPILCQNMHTCLRKYIKSVIKWDLIRKLINFWKLRKNLLKSNSFFYPAIVSVLIRLPADKMIIPAQLDAVLAVNNIEVGERGLWLRNFMAHSLREKCPCSELFWSVFSRIPTVNGEILRTSPYSVRMWENPDQNNSEYGHFLRSIYY